jgi:hypothetical protein
MYKFQFQYRLDLFIKHSSDAISGAFASGRCDSGVSQGTPVPAPPWSGRPLLASGVVLLIVQRGKDCLSSSTGPEETALLPGHEHGPVHAVFESIGGCSGPRGLVTTPAAGTPGSSLGMCYPGISCWFRGRAAAARVRTTGHPCRVARRSVVRNLAGGSFPPAATLIRR